MLFLQCLIKSFLKIKLWKLIPKYVERIVPKYSILFPVKKADFELISIIPLIELRETRAICEILKQLISIIK